MSDAEFERAIADFEQDDLERKRNLGLDTEEAKAEFVMVVAGLGQAGGGTVVFGPLDVWTPAETKRFDPALISNLLTSAVAPQPVIAISRRTLGAANYVLIAVAPPSGSPFILRRQLGKYQAGGLPHRVNTSTRLAVDPQEQMQTWARYLNPTAARTKDEFRARYAGRSADLSLSPGQSGTFAVFYANAGKRPWRRGTVDEARLVHSRFEPENGYISSADRGLVTRQQQTLVAPGQIGTFVFSVHVPPEGGGSAFHYLHPDVGGREIGVDVPFVVHVPMILRGRVTDKSTGAALDNVCITVGVPGEWYWTTTDAAGSYVVDLAATGARSEKWELFFIRPGYETARSPTVSLPGKVQIINVEMTRNDGGTGPVSSAPVPPKVVYPPRAPAT